MLLLPLPPTSPSCRRASAGWRGTGGPKRSSCLLSITNNEADVSLPLPLLLLLLLSLLLCKVLPGDADAEDDDDDDDDDGKGDGTASCCCADAFEGGYGDKAELPKPPLTPTPTPPVRRRYHVGKSRSPTSRSPCLSSGIRCWYRHSHSHLHVPWWHQCRQRRVSGLPPWTPKARSG